MAVNSFANVSMTHHTSSSNSELNESNGEIGNLPVVYTIVETIVAIISAFGNLLTIIVFIQDKKLRKVTNFYIVSLALADLLVGIFGIPSAIFTRIGVPRNAFHVCLSMLSFLLVLCTVSILNLVAVSLDRFWAILYPLNYHRRMSSQAAGCIIISCWILGALIGFLPLFGWNNGPAKSGLCVFIPIMNYDFLVFVFFGTIVFPAALMAFCYLRIYLIVVRQLRQISVFEKNAINPRALKTHKSRFAKRDAMDDSLTKTDSECRDSSTTPEETKKLNWSSRKSNSSATLESTKSTMNNMKITKTKKVSYSRREVKKARKLAIIMIFFIICWIPLYFVNTVQAFCKQCKVPLWLLDAFIIISHINSAVNPILYAYHMKDFRVAMHRVLCKCVLRQQGLRDIRRQELMSITGLQWRNKQKVVAQISESNDSMANGRQESVVNKEKPKQSEYET